MAFSGWDKIEILINSNKKIMAVAPIIISASRVSDIPAFYGDWFINNLKKGLVETINPYNQKIQYVSFKKTRIIVFWSKNPKPFFEYLPYLDKRNINYYFQFTLNDYEKEGFEKKLPPLDYRIKTFIELSNLIGKEKVIWRFDPIILTDKLNVSDILYKIKNIGNKIYKFTDKLVISFVTKYKKVLNRIKKININFIDINDETKVYIAEGLNKINKNWGLQIATCSEPLNLEKFNIIHNKCIDDDLMKKIFFNDTELMNFLNVKYSLKDKGQRKLCNCMVSKDIGRYRTCKYDCIYCYAI